MHTKRFEIAFPAPLSRNLVCVKYRCRDTTKKKNSRHRSVKSQDLKMWFAASWRAYTFAKQKMQEATGISRLLLPFFSSYEWSSAMILISFAGVRRSVRAFLQITGRGQEREIRGKGLRSLSEFATGGSEFTSSPCGFITNGRGAEEKGRARRRSWLLFGKVSSWDHARAKSRVVQIEDTESPRGSPGDPFFLAA